MVTLLLFIFSSIVKCISFLAMVIIGQRKGDSGLGVCINDFCQRLSIKPTSCVDTFKGLGEHLLLCSQRLSIKQHHNTN